ncbi:MAG: hypothetical protein JW800_03130 [Candidatus Omnitrophica bacterium]|nr:hypothetical protein [Candidatus Omnitrophota bacterium]
MLNRYQVLINNWLAEHIKKTAERYDISFSETVRAALCCYYIDMIAKDYPKYSPDMESVKQRATLKEGGYGKIRMEELHKDLSKVYFEARKAIEFFWAEQEHNKGKAGIKK